MGVGVMELIYILYSVYYKVEIHSLIYYILNNFGRPIVLKYENYVILK